MTGRLRRWIGPELRGERVEQDRASDRSPRLIPPIEAVLAAIGCSVGSLCLPIDAFGWRRDTPAMPDQPREPAPKTSDDDQLVRQPVERVVVVGAGIAGLTAAYALGQAGVECVVVEARARVGGRLHTVELAGTPVDLGGSWIHHPVGNPLRAIADRLGVKCVAADPLPGLVGFDCSQDRRLTQDDMDICLRLLFEDFPAAVEHLQHEAGADESMAEAIESFLADLALPPAQHRQIRQALRSEIESESADLTERQSVRWMWNETEYDGGFFGEVPVGGYRSLITPLAAALAILLRFDVDEIAVINDSVRVTSTDGRIEWCSHVVVTVPLGVLKDSRPSFVPPLPHDHRQAIDRLGFGRFEKVALAFAEPFWRTAQLPQLMLLPPDPDEGAVWVFDLGEATPHPVLTAQIPHSAAHHVLDNTADQAVQWILRLLSRAVGGPCPDPIAAAVTTWANDEYSRGSYSHIPPGASPSDADLLGQPVHGRVLFAGEHTQSERLVYTDGAFASGTREARRLLKDPTGSLGALIDP